MIYWRAVFWLLRRSCAYEKSSLSLLQHTATHCNTSSCSVLHYVAVCSSEKCLWEAIPQPQSAMCWHVVQCGAVWCSVVKGGAVCGVGWCSAVQCGEGWCSVLRCVAVRCRIALCCSVLQCVAVYCSVAQCVAVCYSALQFVPVRTQPSASKRSWSNFWKVSLPYYMKWLQSWLLKKEIAAHKVSTG